MRKRASLYRIAVVAGTPLSISDYRLAAATDGAWARPGSLLLPLGGPCAYFPGRA